MLEKKVQQGYALILVVVIVAILSTLAVGLTANVINENHFARVSQNNDQAFHIAEAGVNYYTWFLNHNEQDWQDGQGIPGPYFHDFEDGDGSVVGNFRLEITPPEAGSTIGTITSTGSVIQSDGTSRAVRAEIGVPSLARFAFLTDTDVWFGDTESVDGQLHSNGGIRFDGTGNDTITSAKETYECQDYHGCATGGEEKAGVWGTGTPQSLWEYPVPAVDFDQISADLSNLEDLSQEADGLFLDTTTGSYYGYYLILDDNNTAQANDDSVDVYKVKKTYQDWGYTGEEGWVKYNDRLKTVEFLATYGLPDNGVIFVDDDLWIKGSTSSRLTIAAAHFPESESDYRSIIIVDDLSYYAEDGSVVVGLIAQKDVRVPIDSPSDLEIDAVLLAQKGKVIRPYYSGNTKVKITTFGSVITKLVWTWNWVDGSDNIISGYATTVSRYDPSLLYAPPPYYPTTGTYEVLYWQEVRAE